MATHAKIVDDLQDMEDAISAFDALLVEHSSTMVKHGGRRDFHLPADPDQALEEVADEADMIKEMEAKIQEAKTALAQRQAKAARTEAARAKASVDAQAAISNMHRLLAAGPQTVHQFAEKNSAALLELERIVADARKAGIIPQPDSTHVPCTANMYRGTADAPQLQDPRMKCQADLQDMVDRLERDNAELRKRLRQQDAELQASLQENAGLKGEVAELKENSAEVKERFDRSQARHAKQAEKSRKWIRDLESRNATLISLDREHREKLGGLEERNIQLQERLEVTEKEAAKHILGLEEVNAGLEFQLASVEAERSKLDTTLATMGKMLTGAGIQDHGRETMQWPMFLEQLQEQKTPCALASSQSMSCWQVLAPYEVPNARQLSLVPETAGQLYIFLWARLMRQEPCSVETVALVNLLLRHIGDTGLVWSAAVENIWKWASIRMQTADKNMELQEYAALAWSYSAKVIGVDEHSYGSLAYSQLADAMLSNSVAEFCMANGGKRFQDLILMPSVNNRVLTVDLKGRKVMFVHSDCIGENGLEEGVIYTPEGQEDISVAMEGVGGIVRWFQACEAATSE
ncbi:hypothetical protein MCOR03_010027 [Pyricularia oryzae]|uniref:Uncharacterized protein n=1 Tax=Pyricularia grisea TaxID=148305 RepID=A0ABQ8N659_PYRGI|nr:hypothetical protein MCOR33_010871 [Pyricularia grisea]KAI6549498.1 hypothetical protein MCOR03_010027 [Pyricularia oryzae]KAI6556802.1 hypothetical protein MCOR09_009574 [Pyricularia oryzae]